MVRVWNPAARCGCIPVPEVRWPLAGGVSAATRDFLVVYGLTTLISIAGAIGSVPRRLSTGSFGKQRGAAAFNICAMLALLAGWWFGHKTEIELFPQRAMSIETMLGWFGDIRVPEGLQSEEELIPFSQRRTVFGRAYDWRAGLCDRQGHIRVPAIYESVLPFKEGKAVVKDFNGLEGVIANEGSLIVAPQFESTGWFYSENRLQVKVGGKMGYIDEVGRLVVQPEFDQARFFYNGLATVNKGARLATSRTLLGDIEFRSKGGRWGYIDPQGKLVIPLQFKEAGHFSETRAEVTLEDGSKWFIDRTGKLIEPLASEADS